MSFFQIIRRIFHYLICFFFCVSSLNTACALTFFLPQTGEDVVGCVQWTQALPGDTFNTIGRRFDMGFFELVEANPMLNPFHLVPGTIVVIPSRFILPPGKRIGLVVNLAELRIYYYPTSRSVVITYPVGIGREGWETPLGPSSITEKITNPIWFVPLSIRKDRAKEGVNLPCKVLPGPDNPLGGYAMRLKQSTYLIHGTNDSQGIGRRSSAGCIRLFPEDMESLFFDMALKDRVMIMDVPYKLGWHNHALYLEAHVPLNNNLSIYSFLEKYIKKNNISTIIQGHVLDRIALWKNGIPQRVSG